MRIDIRQDGPKWTVYIWSDDDLSDMDRAPQYNVLSEDTYTELNLWCVETLGIHTRTAYNVFEFRKKSELDWFLLRWS